MKKKTLLIIITLIIVAISCKKSIVSPDPYTATPYELKIPYKFPKPIIPPDNPLTVEGIRLGRMLYYDPILSSNGLSCSSCHIREESFSRPLFTTKTGEKISVPPHINLAWNPNYNWNGSETILHHLCLSDFGEDFFNTSMPELVQKMKHHAQYPLLFKQAFNIDDISTLEYQELQLKIVSAISQFMCTMVSSESRFDKIARYNEVFTPEEWDGFQTFVTERGDCFHCHGYPLMTSNTFENNGLDFATTIGLGRYQITKDSFDIGKFSVPTLRNIELTAPYMHDGRFQTLEEVVEFYNSGVHGESPNISPLLTKPAKKYGLNLTVQQKANLVIFLKTLTDTSFINNPDFKNPF